MGLENDTQKRALICCEVLRPEIERLAKDAKGLSVHYLRQSLHREPQNMALPIQNKIDEITGSVDFIVLGYGLCSNGILGVSARSETLIVPRCHDCLSFFLGSPEAYLEAFENLPGSYYLTPGWIHEGKDPLHILRDEYYPRYGEETAEWAMKEELKHYSHIVLVDTGAEDLDFLRSTARANADYFGLEYIELEGRDLTYFKYLINGPYREDYFIHIKPGEKIEQPFFF